jgi:hypothetical protein
MQVRVGGVAKQHAALALAGWLAGSPLLTVKPPQASCSRSALRRLALLQRLRGRQPVRAQTHVKRVQ